MLSMQDSQDQSEITLCLLDIDADKVKCDENRPQCAQCLERELRCCYPAAVDVGRPSIVRKLQNEAAGLADPYEPVTLSSTGNTFSMLDMQSFHSFLFAATPTQPFANAETWVTKIPSIAYHVSCVVDLT